MVYEKRLTLHLNRSQLRDHFIMGLRVFLSSMGMPLLCLRSRAVKQGRFLIPSLFRMFFSVILEVAFPLDEEAIFLCTDCTESDNPKERFRSSLEKRLLMMWRWPLSVVRGCKVSLTNSPVLAKSLDTNFKENECQGKSENTSHDYYWWSYTLRSVHRPTYLGTTRENLSSDVNIDFKIGKAATTTCNLHQRSWKTLKLTTKTKIRMPEICVLARLLHSSETGTSTLGKAIEWTASAAWDMFLTDSGQS